MIPTRDVRGRASRFENRTHLVGYARGVSLKSKSTGISGGRGCPIAAALDIVGDRWSLLVLRDLSRGIHRFNDIHARNGAPRDRLPGPLRARGGPPGVERPQYNQRPP